MSISRKCTVKDCGRKHYGHGYCQLHYGRIRRNGTLDNLHPKEYHGMHDHYLYKTWESIKQRCYNKNHQNYNRYGGRGIKLYDDWHKFGAFVEYIIANLGDRPEGYTLDRIDNDGNYEPGNLRWADRKTQVRNQGVRSDNTSGAKGISYDKFRNKWLVRVQLGDRYKYIGRYDTQEEALSAILHIESIRHL